METKEKGGEWRTVMGNPYCRSRSSQAGSLGRKRQLQPGHHGREGPVRDQIGRNKEICFGDIGRRQECQGVFMNGRWQSGPRSRPGRGVTGPTAGNRFPGMDDGSTGVHPPSIRIDRAHRSPRPLQCLKWRCPVNTIAMPRASAAAITSASRTEPPG